MYCITVLAIQVLHYFKALPTSFSLSYSERYFLDQFFSVPSGAYLPPSELKVSVKRAATDGSPLKAGRLGTVL